MNTKPCVATIGFFDGVHRGHQFLISRVKHLAQEAGAGVGHHHLPGASADGDTAGLSACSSSRPRRTSAVC